MGDRHPPRNLPVNWCTNASYIANVKKVYRLEYMQLAYQFGNNIQVFRMHCRVELSPFYDSFFWLADIYQIE